MKSWMVLLLAVLAATPAYADFDTALNAYRERDYETAIQGFMEEAGKGNATAMFNVGVMMFRGQGVRTDKVQAFAWIELAAARDPREFGEVRAMMVVQLTPDEMRRGAIQAEVLAQEYGVSYRAPDYLLKPDDISELRISEQRSP